MTTGFGPSEESPVLRIGALASLGVLTYAYLTVLYDAATIVDATDTFLLVVTGALVTALVFVFLVGRRTATVLTSAGVTLGIGYYFAIVPGGWELLTSGGRLLQDLLALMTGYSILTIVGLEVWTAAVTPGPVVLSWYLAIRSRYAHAVGVAMLPLGFFMLTGDLGLGTAIVGIIGASAVLGFGELSTLGGRLDQADVLAMLLAVMLVSSIGLTAVPGGELGQVSIEGGTGDGTPSDTGELDAGNELTISGQPSLSPEVRYTIETDSPGNWRVDAYDRYTGDGWVQTGDRTEFAEETGVHSEETVMEVRTESEGLREMPAHLRATSVDGVEDITRTPEEGLVADARMDQGTTYVVTSVRPNASSAELANAGWEYPTEIEDRYTQMPADTPERVSELTAELTAEDDSPYEMARTVEAYIIETNEYSLDVEPPRGDVADEQLFERDAGYCTFFATTMVAMLRTQDVPARMVTGYSTGEQVDDDRWVVRGLNAHAWVEVYIADVGWVAFDPTPSGPYEDVREEILAEERAAGHENVDTNESAEDDWSPSEDADADAENETDREDLEVHCDDPMAIERGNLTRGEARLVCAPDQLEEMGGIDGVNATGAHAAHTGAQIDDRMLGLADEYEDDTGSGVEGTIDPPLELIAMGVAILVGGVVGIRRRGLDRRLKWAIVDHIGHVDGDPVATTERSWERLQRSLERRYTRRRPHETARSYVERLERHHAIDDRVRDVLGSYERARYSGDGVEPETAREIVATVDEIVSRTRRDP